MRSIVHTHLLSQLWFTLLDRGDEHVSNASSRQSIQATANAMNSDNVQVLTTLNGKQINFRFIQSTIFIIKQLILPVLSAQFITAPTGQASEILNFPPADPPRPESDQIKKYFHQNFILSKSKQISNQKARPR